MTRQQLDSVAQMAVQGVKTRTGKQLDTVIAYTVLENYLAVYKDATRQTYTGEVRVMDLRSMLDTAYANWDKAYTLSKNSVIDYFRATYRSPYRREREQAARHSTFADYARFMRSKAITSAFGV